MADATQCYDCDIPSTFPKVYIEDLDPSGEGGWLCFPHAGLRLQEFVKPQGVEGIDDDEACGECNENPCACLPF